ncbi:MAG: cytochrome c peroxidase [Gammaproteobacteria bacterium]|jgi:cytochrome c peroxidase
MGSLTFLTSAIAALAFFSGAAQGAVAFVDGRVPDPAKVELGRLLFFDKVLSGNLNISCATCHHSLADTGDGLSLPIGEGGVGLGVTRDAGTGSDAVHERVPRNAPPVFMLGSIEVTRLFHDGRVEMDASFPSGFRSPAGHDLPDSLENILAAQAMFPVTSGAEMAGQTGENPVADQAGAGNLAGPGGVWDLLAGRLRSMSEYVDRFGAVFGITAYQIRFAHAANAIAAFEIDAWRADRSAYDEFLNGNAKAKPFNKAENRGHRLFFGKAGCAGCHHGDLLSDMEFHAIAMPQIGPGKGNGASRHEDWGRFLVTGNEADRFRFRTPPLRNVALTAPYGHAGAFQTLEEVVRHHLDPVASLHAYDCGSRTRLPSRADLDAVDCRVMDDPAAVAAIADANELPPVILTDREVDDLIAFLHALTDRSSMDLRRDVPPAVPSGLPLAE